MRDVRFQSPNNIQPFLVVINQFVPSHQIRSCPIYAVDKSFLVETKFCAVRPARRSSFVANSRLFGPVFLLGNRTFFDVYLFRFIIFVG